MSWRRTVLIALTAGLWVTGAAAVTASAGGGNTPGHLSAVGWTCIQPRIDPTLVLCAPPGVGLPPLPGTPGFESRAPSYEFKVFEFATGDFIGTQHLLRPDIYEQGTPPCPQQPGGAYIYNARNDLWSCTRT
ncbi:MAG TPA: hypothetical protein VFJ93_12695 [Gaiellaceae bacterium]|nr:hypothetical protein [Gaiellaceae bacterium]